MSTYRLKRPAYSQPECITQKQNHMKTKEEIRLYLDTQFSPSEDDMVSIVRNDFDRILNSAASCALITVEGAMPVLAERLRTELEALHIEADLDVIIKVSYHPASEISFDNLCSLLTVIHEFAPQVNIVWVAVWMQNWRNPTIRFCC